MNPLTAPARDPSHPSIAAASPGAGPLGGNTGPRRSWPLRLLEPAAFLLCSLPLGKLAADAFAGRLGANPIAEGMNRLGFWTLTFLTLSLVPTPAKDFLGISWPVRIRRMLGLFAFAYAFLHFSWYLGVDQFFAFGEIGKDIAKRKFITIGFATFLLLVPLAITSTGRSVRRLGFRRWKRLHRLVYVAALLGIVHFVWRVKIDLRKPTLFAAAIGALLLLRVVARARRPAPSWATRLSPSCPAGRSLRRDEPPPAGSA